MKQNSRWGENSDNSENVILSIYWISYDDGIPKHGKFFGEDLLDALKCMSDRLNLYLDSRIIEDEGYTVDKILGRIVETNGDGDDYILSITTATGEVLFEEGGFKEEDFLFEEAEASEEGV